MRRWGLRGVLAAAGAAVVLGAVTVPPAPGTATPAAADPAADGCAPGGFPRFGATGRPGDHGRPGPGVAGPGSVEMAEGLRRLHAAPPMAGVTRDESGLRVDEIDAEGWARLREVLPTRTVACDVTGESPVVVVVRHGRAESTSWDLLPKARGGRLTDGLNTGGVAVVH